MWALLGHGCEYVCVGGQIGPQFRMEVATVNPAGNGCCVGRAHGEDLAWSRCYFFFFF